MKRRECATILAKVLLDGKKPTRKEVMEMIDYNADMTHLLITIREWGLPVQCKPQQPANKTYWYLPNEKIDAYRQDTQAFVLTQKKITKKNKKYTASRKVKAISEQYGIEFIKNSITK